MRSRAHPVRVRYHRRGLTAGPPAQARGGGGGLRCSMEGGAVPCLLDILLIGVPAELILKLSGQNATCTLAETCRAAAHSTGPSRAAFRLRPRERGLARLFVLHNDRPSERERDHYAQWRSGWEPQLRETDQLKSWFPSLLPRTYVRVDARICDVDSDSDSDEEPNELAPAEWSCARCTLCNPRTQMLCSACGGERPDMETAPARSSEGRSRSSAHERVYSIAQFARWRGCDAQHFAGIHHGDLVIDEGQYRGHGTFVAIWSSDSGAAAPGEHGRDPDQLLLTPSVGLDGVMLPKDAWSVVQTYGPAYYEAAGYGSFLFAEIPVSEDELAQHDQMVRENDRATAAAAAACEDDAHDVRLREHGARPGYDQALAGDVLLPGPGCDHVYCELRPGTRFTRQDAPRPSDYRLARDGIKGDRRTAGAAGEHVWSSLLPRAFTELELSSSSDLRWRQQQPITSLLQPSAVHAAQTDRSTTPTLWGAGQADTNSCGFPILSENDGVLTEDMAYMMIAPSQQPVVTRDRRATSGSRHREQEHDAFVHDGMARLYNNHWQNRTTGEQDAAVSHDQWMPAFVPAPTPLPTPGKRQTKTYHAIDTVRHPRNSALM